MVFTLSCKDDISGKLDLWHPEIEKRRKKDIMAEIGEASGQGRGIVECEINKCVCEKKKIKRKKKKKRRRKRKMAWEEVRKVEGERKKYAMN
jgi:hypothetical protein